MVVERSNGKSKGKSQKAKVSRSNRKLFRPPEEGLCVGRAREKANGYILSRVETPKKRMLL
jgi:hypothetical protein